MIESVITPEVKARIEEAVRNAEKGTSGEIRVHVEDKCKENPLDHAAFIFHKLGMDKTALRNGVLIYLALEDRKVAIIGDAGINAVTGNEFWESVISTMTAALTRGNLLEGITEGVRLAGEKLQKYFPFSSNDKDELSNQVSFGQQDDNR